MEIILLLILFFTIMAFVFFLDSSGSGTHSYGSTVRQKKTSAEIFESPQWLEGVKVGYVIDGDTVVVIWDNQKIKIRLYGIDCPEDGQEWGDIATAGLIKMIGGKYVNLEVFGVDVYDRILATVYIQEDSESVNINEKMVVKGHAWVMRRYYKELSKERKTQLNKLESWAKKKRVGLWRNDNPVPPWKWRNSN